MPTSRLEVTMKKLVILSSFIFCSIFSFAQAQNVPVTVPISDPNDDFLKLLLESFNGMKGATTIAIVAIVLKLLINALNLPIVDRILGSKFKDWTGGIKLTIVLALSYIGGVVGLMAPPTNLSFGAALIHSSTLAAFMVLSNQIWQHYFKKKEDSEV